MCERKQEHHHEQHKKHLECSESHSNSSNYPSNGCEDHKFDTAAYYWIGDHNDYSH